MLIRKKDISEFLVEKPKDGKGLLHKWDYISDKVLLNSNTSGLSLSSFSYLELEPGSEIGFHQHKDNMEVYYIINGSGEVSDNGVKQSVTSGDFLLTGRGESHSLYNNNNKVMTLVAFICA
ncbi:MAG: cupin domain-containing protein [bacterium]